ncbi:MAG: lipid-A-disaccharide synthase [Gammaproteobacteria bacterium]|nr:lipid-A-disaccharide synthase [Gammaproteobacteria bacterium]
MGNNTHPLHIGIVAGEASGDLLGAGLIEALREQAPDTMFEGIAGPRMQEAGCFSLYPMERLSVMGIAEVVRHLPGLLSMRRELGEHFLNTPPDIFIGVDAPDFNLALERKLKRNGIRTLHYVSPSVWAWRQYRVRKIARSIDCMLTLFPFEERFYREQHLPVRCVGHPLADLLADEIDQAQARQHLGLDNNGGLVALLPGSRADEVKRLAGPFIGAAARCRERKPDLEFVVPLANNRCRVLFEKELARARTAIPMTLLEGKSLEAMAAADAVLLASGTAALECMLLKRPMVVAYRLSSLTYRIAQRLVKTRYYSLPNLLAGQPVVRELIQDEVTADNLGRELMKILDDPDHSVEVRAIFARIHDDLRRDANRSAAQAVLDTLGHHGG